MTGLLPPLLPLHAFTVAASCGSFQEAAAKLGLTPSAVSHRIRQLESWAGAPLFSRAPRKVVLTREGRQLAKAATRAFASLAAAGAQVRQRDAHRLRISTLPLFNEAILIPRLARFEARHPAIAIEIETSNRLADLERGEADIAIRNLTAKPAGLAAMKLMDVRPVVLAPPEIARRLRTPSDLALEVLIDVTSRRGGWEQWLKAAGVPGLQPRRRIGFDTVPAALAAASRGRGVTLALDPIVRDSAQALGLVDPFGLRLPSVSSYYLVHRRDHRARPEISAFVTWIWSELSDFMQNRR